MKTPFYHQFLHTVLCLALLLILPGLQAYGQPPIEIPDAATLAKIGSDPNYPLDGEYIQTADIDLSGYSNWTPIGNTSNRFTGQYNGDYYTISGLSMSGSEFGRRIGLFGVVGEGAVLENMHLAGFNIQFTGEYRYIGTLAGENRGLIRRVAVTDSHVMGWQNVGGLAGQNIVPGAIEQSYTDLHVSGNEFSDDLNTESGDTGGLAGSNFHAASITNSYAVGEVQGIRNVGGLVGYSTANGSTVTNSYSSGKVTGDTNTGGLIGLNAGTITHSYWNMTTSEQTSSAGGTGKTDTEMRSQNTFLPEWDFDDIWAIDEGKSQPYLQWQKELKPSANNILYVNQNVNSGSKTGSSWANAVPELRDALAWAQSWDYDEDGALQIWVAEGLYLPVDVVDTDDVTEEERKVSFQLVNGVQIYGGFSGGEEFLDDRNWEDNLTILSGDIDRNDDVNSGVTETWEDINGLNSFHVLYLEGESETPITEATIINGFTITGGLANEDFPYEQGGGMWSSESSPTLANLIFSGNFADSYGGGMNNFTSNPTLTNIIFMGNHAGRSGGGIYNRKSSPMLTNVSFINNTANNSGGGMSNPSDSNPTLTNISFRNNAAQYGGGMQINNSSPILTNVTFIGNKAGAQGGGIFYLAPEASALILTNVIMWGNQADGESGTESASIEIYYNFSVPQISHSLIANSGGSGDDWNEYFGEDLGNNIDDDPRFADPDNGDLTLLPASPAINAGTNTPFEAGGVAENVTTDLAGKSRIFNAGTVDMGAYEYQGVVDYPEGENRRVLASNASTFTFSGDDFGVAEETQTIHITSVPDDGTFSANVGDKLTIEEINNGDLTWIPPDGQYGYNFTSFTITIIDENDLESAEYSLTIDLAATSVELTGDEGWRFLTNPASGEAIGSFLDPLWTQGFAGSDNPGANFSNVQRLNQHDYEWDTDVKASDMFERGLGVIVYIFEDANGDGSSGDFPVTLSSGEHWKNLFEEFDYSPLLGYDPDQGPQGNSHFLVANPHPVALDFCEFTSSNVAQSIDIWDPTHNDGDYISLGCPADDVHIPPFGVFWVRTTDQNPTLSIPEDAYIGSVVDDNFKNQSSESDEDPIAELTVHGGENEFTAATRILFSSRGTTGADELDAPKLSPQGLAEAWLSLYSMDESGQAYSLQSLPTPGGEDQRIPLGIHTTEAGIYTMEWQLPNQSILAGSYFIKDLKTGELLKLRKGTTYRFEIDEEQAVKKLNDESSEKLHGNFTDFGKTAPRFELLISSNAIDGFGEPGNLPSEFTLNQNYPNPFNPVTQISYELPQTEQVRLEVYDMAGRQVATLVNGHVAAGRHTVSFDGSRLSSGVYMYRLQAGSQIQTRKLTILK